MNPKDTMKAYVDALNQNSAEECEKLFTSDGVVISPIYGEKKANIFFKEMFGDSSNTKIDLINIFLSEDESAGAAHFICHWTLKDGTPTTLNVADIFEFSEDGKIKKLLIIYDAQEARDAVDNL